MDSKLDRLEKDLKEYRRAYEEKTNAHEGLYTEENLNMIISELTESKEKKVFIYTKKS